jgi:hypothetical protein
MSLAPQDSGIAQTSEETTEFDAPSTVGNPGGAPQTGRLPGRAEPCRLPLGHGLFALVDADDFATVGVHRWHLKRKKSQPGKYYAQRTVRLGNGRNAPKTAVQLHREIMAAGPGQVIDHRNGNGLDNRRENLRVTDVRGNATNVVHSKNRKRGGFKGVSWNRNAEKWQASICAGEVRANGRRKQLYLGIFEDAADAARAYDAAAREHFGEFAALNFPEVAA